MVEDRQMSGKQLAAALAGADSLVVIKGRRGANVLAKWPSGNRSVMVAQGLSRERAFVVATAAARFLGGEE
jgi:hypothetical protein